MRDVSYVMLWVLVLAEAVAILLLFRHFGLQQLETSGAITRDGLPVGDPLPTLRGRSVDELPAAWQPEGDKPALVVFTSAACEPCREIMPLLDELTDREDLETVAIVARDSGGVDSLAELAPRLRLIQEHEAPLFGPARVRVTPFAFVVDAEGRIRSKGLASNGTLLARLLEAAGIIDGIPDVVTVADGNALKILEYR